MTTTATMIATTTISDYNGDHVSVGDELRGDGDLRAVVLDVISPDAATIRITAGINDNTRRNPAAGIVDLEHFSRSRWRRSAR